uniref:GG16304 n=1 Tax=Drosophila erecta TaxID=7220 RepID=B3P3A3_DROER
MRHVAAIRQMMQQDAGHWNEYAKRTGNGARSGMGQVNRLERHLHLQGSSFQLPVPDSRLLPLAARGDSFDNRMYRNRKRKDQCQEQQQLIPEFKPE